jgi:hypothetical protein
MTEKQKRKHIAALKRLSTVQKLDALFVLLVAWLPLRRPIRWEFFHGPHLGEYVFERAHIIRIKKGPFNDMRDTLVHEYAHALADEACPEMEEHHSDLWGVHFARCYRTLEQHWDGPEW